MTKQLVALALVAAFGMAHAADTKPATETKPTAVKVAADTPKAAPDAAMGKTEMKTEMGSNADKPQHKARKHAHKRMHKKGDAAMSNSAMPATPAEPAKK